MTDVAISLAPGRSPQRPDAASEQLDSLIHAAVSVGIFVIFVSLGVVAYALRAYDALQAAAFCEGIGATLLGISSAAFLCAAMLGTQKQLRLTRDQNAHLEREAERRHFELLADRRIVTIDRALSMRFELLHGNARNAGSVQDEIEHYVSWAQSYIAPCTTIDDLRRKVTAFFNDTTFGELPYVILLRQILVTASCSAKDFIDSEFDQTFSNERFLDHAWNGLGLHERAIAILLMLVGDGEIATPSKRTLELSAHAIDRIAPWPGMSVMGIVECRR